MRALGLALLVLGIIGLVLGALAAAGLAVIDHTDAPATWQGVGPMLAGLMLLLFGVYAVLRRA